MGPHLELEPLPIDALLPRIVEEVRSGRDLVLTAPPGAGKTTRVPRALLDAGLAVRGEILILEPRRIAARLAARRVAEELGEKPGGRVGYSVRFEHVAGPATRIRFLTEAVLLRMILGSPSLERVSAIVLDEFHERHVETDLALALARGIQRRGRPDLRILVMSATIDPAPVAEFLPGSAILSAGGTTYDLRIEHAALESGAPMDEQVRRAVERIHSEGPAGDILVFLPGAAEIRRCIERLAPLAESRDIRLLPLHGDLAPAEQERAVTPSPEPKIVLATNVAESSVTIPAVRSVVDTGLARIAGHSPWNGLPLLRLAKISRASAAQRAGRAGRTGPGRVLRLYTQPDHDARPASDLPEIRRADLAETVLLLHGAGVADPRRFEWFEAPPEAALAAAGQLLGMLGALAKDGTITDAGRRMLRLPLHPRLSRIILEGERRGAAGDAILAATLLSEREKGWLPPVAIGARNHRKVAGAGSSDMLEAMDIVRRGSAPRRPGEKLSGSAREGAAWQARVRQVCGQLERALGRSAAAEADGETLRLCLLAGFPDRVARRRAAGSRDLLLATGGTARLGDSSCVHDAPLLVALDAEERREDTAPRARARVLVRLASAVEEEWLADLFPEFLAEERTLQWNEQGERVDEARRTFYLKMLLEERVLPAAGDANAARILSDRLLSRGLKELAGGEEIESLSVRLGLLARHFPEERIGVIGEQEVRLAAETACIGRTRLSEVRNISIADAFLSRLSARQRELLSRETPERIAVGSRRSVRVQYERDRPPWIASRLQDFFGVRRSPAICRGRVLLSVHLLAPNGRPVQVTQDLAGFWERHYPAVRRELRRRYPKHAWPEPDQV